MTNKINKLNSDNSQEQYVVIYDIGRGIVFANKTHDGLICYCSLDNCGKYSKAEAKRISSFHDQSSYHKLSDVMELAQLHLNACDLSKLKRDLQE